MPLRYEFSSDLTSFLILSDCHTLNSLDDYMKMIIYNAVKILTGKTSFELKKTNEPNFKEYLIIFSKKHHLKVQIKGDYLVIIYQNITYYFEHNYTIKGGILELSKFNAVNKNREITEAFDTHYLRLQIKIVDTIYELNIPYDYSTTIDLNTFSTLNQNSTITSLKNLYLSIFAPKQDDYNYNKLETTLSIAKPNRTEILSLKSGKTIYYEATLILNDLSLTASRKENAKANININGITKDYLPILNELIYGLLVKVENNFPESYLKR